MWNKKILMCRPEFYSINYEINDWMYVENKVDTELAQEQWMRLHHLVIRCGGYVEYIEPQMMFPDMVFTANAGIIKENKFFASSFHHDERKGEERYWTEWFLDNGYEVSKLSKNMNISFEGAGDCLAWGKYLIGAKGVRSGAGSSRIAGKRIGYDEENIKEVKLVSKFYHLDTCFCPLNSEYALAYHPAFDSFLNGPADVGKIIEVSNEDADKFACNSVVIGDHVIMPSGCEDTANKVAELGFKVHLTDMSEFIKSGGACKCLTLELPLS
jgi:N-dimethylarginine dimethylaminohydrolase